MYNVIPLGNTKQKVKELFLCKCVCMCVCVFMSIEKAVWGYTHSSHWLPCQVSVEELFLYKLLYGLTCYNKPKFFNVKPKNNWEVKKQGMKREGGCGQKDRRRPGEYSFLEARKECSQREIDLKCSSGQFI